ncbi:peptide ABC transporter permease [Anaerocolumna cellulosilytica]|uniref:Peptide ABC transporter permease n=1 Tax=Anaerocolumna cellulosilytica TaxID=433286 RepID=A0A6S6R4F4_9FIRM|nr:ABC transporter permease [Anaerocolumna cellulosilytica]MBB5194757.1 peptide/nickel transport system permease protein [Anaerocolumna cellulosilytica]BCJ94280.1 peptide ABC transporter permease [Anaerocolumna cellulosilytica]
MKQYIIKRLLVLIPVFIGISIIIFALIHSAPGDPYAYMVESGLPIEEKEIQLQKIGYYDSLPIKYIKWVGNVFQGNLGYSIRYAEPVATVIGRRIGNTALLSITSLVVSSILSIFLGIIAAVKKKTVTDYIISVLSLIGISLPTFFLALGLIKILSIDLNVLPVSGIETTGANYTGWKRAVDIFKHMFLPFLVITCTQTASMVRYTRSAMLEVLGQDYIRTARAKGLAGRVVINLHAFRNTLIPITTLIAMSLGNLLSGTVLIETVFVWPGMGNLLYQAVSNRDYPLIVSGTLFLSICTLLANLLADILYGIIDPRIRYN